MLSYSIFKSICKCGNTFGRKNLVTLNYLFVCLVLFRRFMFSIKMAMFAINLKLPPYSCRHFQFQDLSFLKEKL